MAITKIPTAFWLLWGGLLPALILADGFISPPPSGPSTLTNYCIGQSIKIEWTSIPDQLDLVLVPQGATDFTGLTRIFTARTGDDRSSTDSVFWTVETNMAYGANKQFSLAMFETGIKALFSSANFLINSCGSGGGGGVTGIVTSNVMSTYSSASTSSSRSSSSSSRTTSVFTSRASIKTSTSALGTDHVTPSDDGGGSFPTGDVTPIQFDTANVGAIATSRPNEAPGYAADWKLKVGAGVVGALGVML